MTMRVPPPGGMAETDRYPRSDIAAQSFYGRWGNSKTFVAAAGQLPALAVPEVIRAATPTPSTWSLLLTANADPAALGLLTLDVVFTMTVGLGSSMTTFVRTLSLTAANPSRDASLIVPAQTLSVSVSATSAGRPTQDLQLDVTAMSAPFSPTSYKF